MGVTDRGERARERPKWRGLPTRPVRGDHAVEVRPWARVAGDVNVGIRRGAWYQVIRLTPEAAWLDVFYRTLSVPRECLEIVTVRPDLWSVVARPYDAVDLPVKWGSGYAVCPRCSR